MYKPIILCFGILIFSLMANCQNEKNDIVQFSGVVVTADSLKPLPYTNISIKSRKVGTISDYYGFFSIVAVKGEEVEFTSMGYKKVVYKIPDTLSTNHYSLIQMMSLDTVWLNETVIFPWPTYEQFKQAIIKLELPYDDVDRAEKNLILAKLKEEKYPLPFDGGLNYKELIRERKDQYYYMGQYPPFSLLDPFAWMKFFDAWKNGDFKQNK